MATMTTSLPSSQLDTREIKSEGENSDEEKKKLGRRIRGDSGAPPQVENTNECRQSFSYSFEVLKRGAKS